MMKSLTQLPHRKACVVFVLKGLLKREGKTFQQGRFQNPLAPETYDFAKVPDLDEGAETHFQEIWNFEFPFWKDLSPSEVLANIRIKGLRQNAQLALLAYYQNQWPLLGLWDYPTPEELLKIQATGQRVVSVLLDKDYEEMITADKNNLDFTIHDLEHAAKYFEVPENFEAQKNQFQLFLKLANEKLIHELCQNDPLYLKDWHYLISDMNTAPAHSWFFFRGTLLNAFKRKAMIPMTEKLPSAFETEFIEFEQHCLNNYFAIGT